MCDPKPFSGTETERDYNLPVGVGYYVRQSADMPSQSKADAILTPQDSSEEDASLLDILDHVLNTGIVVHGSLVISVAGVDLVYLGLNAILTSVETALKHVEGRSLPS